MKKLLITSTLALVLSAYQADALTINPLVGGAPTGVNYLNFDDLTPNTSGNLVTFGTAGGVSVVITPDGKVASGSVSGQYAAPYISGSNGVAFGNANGVDTTPYLTTGNTATTGGSVTLLFSSLNQYFGLLWGSVDNYNTLSFYNGNTLVNSVTGTQVWGGANGDQGVNGTFYVNINTDAGFNKVVATSTQYAFEFDNVAYNTTPAGVPDGGATVALLGVAMSGLAFIRRKVN